MDRSLPVADCLEGGVEVGGGHGDDLLAVGLLQELVLLARGLPQLRADVHQQVHVGALGRCCPGSTALDQSEVSTDYC